MTPLFTRWMIILGSCFVCFSCTSPTHSGAASTLQLHLSGEPTVLNPILSTDASSSSVEGLIFSGLFRINSTLELEPDLAESYAVNETGTRYTFKLKKNVKWHDGHKFTAKDVKFTMDTVLNKKTNTVRRSNFIIGGTPIQFKVIDDYTFEALLPKPFAPFLMRMAIGILPEHALKDIDINTASFNRSPIGTGPYKFKQWQPAQYVYLERNSNYYLDAPKVKTIIMKIVPDTNTALLAFEKQEVDEVGIPGKDLKRYQDESFLTLYRYYDLVYTYLGFNLNHPFFSDPNVRRAIAHAVDKSALVNGVLMGFGTKADIPSSPALWSYPPNDQIPIFDFDPKKAADLLASSGFTMNPNTKILEKNGQPFSFKIITNKGNKDREKTAQMIQQMLRKVGINASIQLMEWSSFIATINAKKTPKPFDAVILGWALGLDPDGHSIWHSSQYPNGFNFIGYNNPAVDKLLEQGRTTIESSDRKNIYHRIYKLIANDVPYVFLYFPETLQGINNRVKGLSPAGPAGLMNPIENVYLVE
jgi:peptide/nickel transport system substrate-binding protein